MQDLIGIAAEMRAVFRNISADLFQLLRRSRAVMHLMREVDACAVRTQKQLAAVHSGAGEIADDRLFSAGKSQHDDDAARLIFSEEAAGPAADHHDRHLILIGLHMDSGAVAGIALDKDLAAAHRIARRIPDIAVYNDLTVIHRIADGILCIAEGLDHRTVEICAERIARNAVDSDFLAGHSGRNKPLPDASGNRDLPVIRFAQGFIELLKSEICRIQFHIRPLLSAHDRGKRCPWPQAAVPRADAQNRPRKAASDSGSAPYKCRSGAYVRAA